VKPAAPKAVPSGDRNAADKAAAQRAKQGSTATSAPSKAKQMPKPGDRKIERN
jgi:hypothetical protein